MTFKSNPKHCTTAVLGLAVSTQNSRVSWVLQPFEWLYSYFREIYALQLGWCQQPNLEVIQVVLQQHDGSQKELSTMSGKHSSFLRHAVVFCSVSTYILSPSELLCLASSWVPLSIKETSCLYFIVGGRGFRWILGTSVCCQFTEEASSLWGNWLNEVQRRKMTTLVKDVKQSQPVDPQSYAREPQSSWWQVLLLSCQADRVPTRVDTGSLFLGGSTLCLAVLFFAFLWTASCLNVL